MKMFLTRIGFGLNGVIYRVTLPVDPAARHPNPAWPNVVEVLKDVKGIGLLPI